MGLQPTVPGVSSLCTSRPWPAFHPWKCSRTAPCGPLFCWPFSWHCLRRWTELWRELRNRKLLVMLTLSTLFIAANWLTFIYAVTTGQVLQASLGYFINPLVNVLLGVLFLHERLRPRQTLSIGLALVGVLMLTAIAGGVPWVALALAFTFALYALMRKLMPVDGLVSLTVETLIMAPLALAYLGYHAAATGHGPLGLRTVGLLILSGPIRVESSAR